MADTGDAETTPQVLLVRTHGEVSAALPAIAAALQGAAQRTTEIGVRMALGALRADIARMVLRHGALVLSVGVGLGLIGAFAGSRYVQSLLFNAAGADPSVFAVAIVVVVLAALLGCVVPAIRAARVDPAVALRAE